MVESSISDDICRHQLIQLTSPDLLNFICKSNVENLISKGFHIFSVNSLVLYICLIYVFALTFCLHIYIPFQDFDQSPAYSLLSTLHLIYMYLSSYIYLSIIVCIQDTIFTSLQKSWFESIFLGVKHWPKS